MHSQYKVNLEINERFSKNAMKVCSRNNLNMTCCVLLSVHCDTLHCGAVYHQESMVLYSALSLLSSIPQTPLNQYSRTQLRVFGPSILC